jgi:hypothetical protein
MREVQVALNAYLQSKQAGEQMLRDAFQRPLVQSFLGTINQLLPKVSGTINDVKTLGEARIAATPDSLRPDLPSFLAHVPL